MERCQQYRDGLDHYVARRSPNRCPLLLVVQGDFMNGKTAQQVQYVATQFLVESASMGVIGGILGASLGVMTVVAVSAYETWTPVLDPAAVFLAPLIGGVIGALSGTYPALRAARQEPIEAFRN
jgi:hypothetical protein